MCYVNNKNIRTLKLEFSNCGKTYQKNHFLLKKTRTEYFIYKITKPIS